MTEIYVKVPLDFIGTPFDDYDMWIATVTDPNTMWINPHLTETKRCFLEQNIVPILIHEILHQVIWKVENRHVSRGFDLFFKDDTGQKINFCRDLL